MVGVGKDLCGSSSPTLLLKQGHLQQAAQDLVQVGLEYLQRRKPPLSALGHSASSLSSKEYTYPNHGQLVSPGGCCSLLLRVKKPFKRMITFLMCKGIDFFHGKEQHRVQEIFCKSLYE